MFWSQKKGGTDDVFVCECQENKASSKFHIEQIKNMWTYKLSVWSQKTETINSSSSFLSQMEMKLKSST